MATQAADAVGPKPAGSFAALADRWIWVFMAALFFVTVLTGFIPTSLAKLEGVSTGARPPLPGFMHFHAVAMGAWILMLLAQSTLMASGNRSLHMKLGITSVVLIPAVIIGMVGVTGSTLTQLALMPDGLMPAEALEARRELMSNIVLGQIRSVFLFSALTFWAILVRQTDPGTHKRLMFIATLPPLSAAIDRYEWLAGVLPQGPIYWDITQLIWVAPLLIYDLWRRGALHKAWVIGIGLNLPFIAITHIAWGTDWWVGFAPTIFGIQSW